MTDQPLKLYWNELLIGQVTDATWSDFPWKTAKVTITSMPTDLQAAMEYLHTQACSDDGVTDWPFPEEFVWGWRIVQPDGSAEEISQPIIDFESGDIDWR